MIYAYRSKLDQSVRAIRKSDFDEDSWKRACSVIAGMDTATWCFGTEQEFRDFAPNGVEMYDRSKDKPDAGVSR